MILSYLHSGDVPLSFWIVFLLLAGLLMILALVAFVAILKAIDRRSPRRNVDH
jgi:hypothetical protein